MQKATSAQSLALHDVALIGVGWVDEHRGAAAILVRRASALVRLRPALRKTAQQLLEPSVCLRRQAQGHRIEIAAVECAGMGSATDELPVDHHLDIAVVSGGQHPVRSDRMAVVMGRSL